MNGSSIDYHEDANGEEGMCNLIRQAEVTGEIKDGRFTATSFKLLPLDDKAIIKAHGGTKENAHSQAENDFKGGEHQHATEGEHDDDTLEDSNRHGKSTAVQGP